MENTNEMKKEMYEGVNMEIIEFERTDIIITSTQGGIIQGPNDTEILPIK